MPRTNLAETLIGAAVGRRAGLLYKQSFAGLTHAQIFRHALRDFQENHPAHIAFYLAR